MLSTWPHARLSSRWHCAWQPREFGLSFSLFTLKLRSVLLVKCASCRHSLRENLSSVENCWHPTWYFFHFFIFYFYFLRNPWLQTLYQKLDGFRSLLPLLWTIQGNGKEILLAKIYFIFCLCETSEPAVNLTKVSYLSSNRDTLETLNTTRSDIFCFSALFSWKTVVIICHHRWRADP